MPDGCADDFQMRELPRQGMRELFITNAGLAATHLGSVAACLQQEFAASVLAAECFGPRLNGSSKSLTSTVLSQVGMPLTWVGDGTDPVRSAVPISDWRSQSQGSVSDGAPGSAPDEAGDRPLLGGAHLWAVTGVDVRPLVLDGVTVGSLVEGPYATECLLGGIHAPDIEAPRDRQARLTFERIEQALALAGMDFSHVARTWLFLDDILSWYGDFNRARTDFFTERGVFDGVVPASTGIGGGNPFGAALVAGAYALMEGPGRGRMGPYPIRPTVGDPGRMEYGPIRPLPSPSVRVEAVPSPLQCPALEYGSSFSRAVEVAMPDMRRLLVSGTASIAPEGHTEHVGDVAGQTARTCEVVAAILQSRGMGWENVTRATAYVRHAEDAGVFAEYCVAAGLPAVPVVVAHNVICRDDLLFELEVDAVRVCQE